MDDEDPYFNTDRRTWLDGHRNLSVGVTSTVEPVVVIKESSLKSIPLLVALIVCIVLMIGLIYRFKCSHRGKPKKLPVDDGDYLINGMYL